MFPTTVDAIKAILKADTTVTVDERVWIVACIETTGNRLETSNSSHLRGA